MSQEFDAIYERGVFRPLAPVALPEAAKVHLKIEDVSTSEPSAHANELALQKAAMAELLAWVEQQPAVNEFESISASDHDQFLYGWKK